MTIKSIQKVIQIGSSAGNIIPAREMKRAGIRVGDEVEISFRKLKKNTQHKDEEVIAAAQNILKRYKEDFKNLADR